MKIDMLGYDGFLIQRDQHNSKEFIAVSLTCSMNRIPYKLEKTTHDTQNHTNYICVGSVEWVEKKVGQKYCSKLLSRLLKRSFT